MTMKNRKYIIILFIVGTFCWQAGAIVVENYSVATNAPTGDWDLNWDYVYNYKNSSSVAVGEYWILTAAHVADDGPSGDLTIAGTTYFQQEIIYHAGVDDPDNADNADLALVRYDKPLPGFYDLYTGSLSTGSEFIMVGFGNTGTVVEVIEGGGHGGPPGLPSPVTTNYYYTDSGAGRGTKRWGTQSYSIPSTKTYTADPLTTTNKGFIMSFNVADTTYEAGVGTYDSGGGTFVEENGAWKLAGINTTRDGIGSQYTSTFAVSVPDYATWITNTMNAVTGDADDDGIPNWWEQQYATNIVAGTDQDGDGFIGANEYIADTDPTDSNSFFEMEGAITAAEQTFTFDGSPARQYQLVYTTNDLAATNLTWITNGVPVWGEGAGTEITVTNTEPMVFYRMEAILP